MAVISFKINVFVKKMFKKMLNVFLGGRVKFNSYLVAFLASFNCLFGWPCKFLDLLSCSSGVFLPSLYNPVFLYFSKIKIMATLTIATQLYDYNQKLPRRPGCGLAE